MIRSWIASAETGQVSLAWATPRRQSLVPTFGRQQGGLMLRVDLQGLKAVRDGLGLQAGECLLSIMVRRLRRRVRPGDVVFRLRADGIGIALGSDLTPSQLQDIARRAAAAVAEPAVVNGCFVVVSGVFALVPSSQVEIVDAGLSRALRKTLTAMRLAGIQGWRHMSDGLLKLKAALASGRPASPAPGAD